MSGPCVALTVALLSPNLLLHPSPPFPHNTTPHVHTLTPHGRSHHQLYFYNKKTRETTYALPPELRGIVGEDGVPLRPPTTAPGGTTITSSSTPGDGSRSAFLLPPSAAAPSHGTPIRTAVAGSASPSALQDPPRHVQVPQCVYVCQCTHATHTHTQCTHATYTHTHKCPHRTGQGSGS